MSPLDGTLVGSGGFKGAPDDAGAVELGYITFLHARGTGVSTGIAAALVEVAAAEGASSVIAHTLPEESASTRVLRSNGFRHDSDIVDPDDGPVWRWERVLQAGER
jgi:ribosomal-protein-alanine N-acetyltransferase